MLYALYDFNIKKQIKVFKADSNKKAIDKIIQSNLIYVPPTVLYKTNTINTFSYFIELRKVSEYDKIIFNFEFIKPYEKALIYNNFIENLLINHVHTFILVNNRIKNF